MASISSFIAALSNVRDSRTLKQLFDAMRTESGAGRTLANELRTDHGSFKTAVDTGKTLTDELHDDHASFKTAVDTSKTLTDELHDDHATNKTHMDDLKTAINALIAALKADGIINATALGVGSTPEQIASTAVQYLIDGVAYHKAAVAAGTAFTAADTINTGAAAGFFWGIWAVQIDAAGTISTKSPGADQVYADEATAIAALPAADAGNVVIGYVTVKTLEDVDWVAITDDLTDASDCTEAKFYNTASSIPAAVSSSAAATITAAKATAGPATITAAKATAGPATISAAALTESLEE